MGNFNLARETENMRRELTAIIKELKDPRVAKSMVSIIRLSITNDFSYAKVYVSAVMSSKQTKEAVEGLKSAEGFIKQELASRLSIRKMPKLIFILDESAEYSDRINRKLNTIFERGNLDNEG